MSFDATSAQQCVGSDETSVFAAKEKRPYSATEKKPALFLFDSVVLGSSTNYSHRAISSTPLLCITLRRSPLCPLELLRSTAPGKLPGP